MNIGGDYGNVWYFGEDVTNFEYNAAGRLVGTNSPALAIPLADLKAANVPAEVHPGPAVTLGDAEREPILHAVEEAYWAWLARTGAATRLAMKRTTLQSKMKKLGISRPR